MIYFDNAATTLHKPECVLQAVADALGSFGNSGRGAHGGAMHASRMIFEAREALAGLLGAEGADCIAFTSNATAALNIAIKGVLNPGDHVITTVLEHNSVLRPLYEMESRGVELTILPADAKGNLKYETIKPAIRTNTKAIVCTHGSNLTGNLTDLSYIGGIAKKHGLIFICDASQTAGVIPVNVQHSGIDILCFTGHKGLLGPQGTGGLYVRTGIKVRPLHSGGSGIQTYLKSHPARMPEALEAGTLNGHGIAGLLAAVRYIQEKSLDAIQKTERDLMNYFYDEVKQISGITLYGDFSGEERCPTVALNVRDYDSGQVSQVLAEAYGIATRPGAHCAPLMHQSLGTVEQGAVRFSFSHFNTKNEIQMAVAALRELAKEE